MNVAELAGWLDQTAFDLEFEAARELARTDPKVKWAVQETLRAPLPFLTKKAAEECLSARKKELEELGFDVIGSIQRGGIIYGDGEAYFGAAVITGRRKNPPKG